MPLDGVYFGNLTDYDGVAFSSICKRVNGVGSHIFGNLRVKKPFAQK